MPAVRFAFPLGAGLNTTLRARPCQELFSESFSRPSRGPRGAPPSGLRPFAAASSVLYAPRARRGRETRPHTGCRQLQLGGARGWRAVRALGRHRVGASPRPACEVARIQLPIYRQEDRPRLQAGSLPRRHASRASPIVGFPLLASAKLLAEGVASREKNGRLRARPPSARAIPSATVPGRFSMSEGFHHFDIEEAKARPPIRMLKHFHRVRSYACMPKRPWHGLKTKKKRAADAALFLNRYIWRQSYASLKNFFLPT